MADPLTPATDPLTPSYKPDPAAMSPGGATSAQVVGGLKEQIAGARKLMGEAEETRNAGIKALAQTREAQESERHENELKRLELQAEQPVPEKPTEAPHQNQTDAMKAWGSAAMMISMLGSLLTRAPMTSALNAASKAIDAFHQNDIDAYNTAFKQWQVESTNAEKMFQHQQAAYEKLLAQADRHENETDQHYAKRISDMERELAWLATSFRDEKGLMALGVSGYKGMEQAIAVEKSFFARMTAEADAMVKTSPERIASMGLVRDPEFQEALAVANDPKASREDKIKAAATLRKMAISIGPNSAARMEAQAGKMVESATKEIFEQNPVGKEYRYLQSADVQSTLQNAMNELKTKHMVDPYLSAALKEAFTKSSTGGQAIRGFMVKLIQDQYPYSDVAKTMFNRFWNTGGGLDDNQGNLLIKMVDQYIRNNAVSTAKAIDDKATSLEPYIGEEGANAIRKSESALIGLVNTIHEQRSGSPSPAATSGSQRKPSSAAIDAVKKDPNLKQKFIEAFGQEAYDKAVGGPAGRSGTFRPVADAQPILSQLFPGIHINREYSSPSDPTGYPGDWHHRSHAAVDVRPSSVPGMTFDQFIRKIENAGYHIIEKRDEVKHPSGRSTGPHWHVVIGENNG